MDRYAKFRAAKLTRRLKRLACSHLYRDTKPDSGKSVIVAGAGRSGTTWLADIVSTSEPGCRVMFEPFHSGKLGEFQSFSYFHYMRPDETDQELMTFSRAVITGRLRHPWIDRHVEVLRPRWRLIKEIRACLFLRWLHGHFPEVPILFIIRHPCAVVASRLALDWATDGDIEPFLTQTKLMEDHLHEYMPLIEAARFAEEKHAIVWCVSNLVPLRQFSDAGLKVVFYENLCRRPDREISSILDSLSRRSDDKVLGAADRISTTSRRGSAVVQGDDPVTRWRRELSGEQTSRVLQVVDGFGLGYLYGQSDTPSPLAIERLAGSISAGGHPN